MAPYQVLIFDFDGTLCDTEDSILYSFQETFAHYKAVPPSESDIMWAVSTGGSLPELLPLLHASLAKEDLPEWVGTYRHIYSTQGAKRTTLFEGARQVLEVATAAGLECVVISNKGQQAIEEGLRHFNIASYFDLVIGDNPALPLKKKPDPMAFQELIVPQYPDVTKQQFLMIGDTHVDLAFANNALIGSCWAAFGYGDKALCQLENPTHSIQHMAELLPVILPAQ